MICLLLLSSKTHNSRLNGVVGGGGGGGRLRGRKQGEGKMDFLVSMYTLIVQLWARGIANVVGVVGVLFIGYSGGRTTFHRLKWGGGGSTTFQRWKNLFSSLRGIKAWKIIEILESVAMSSLQYTLLKWCFLCIVVPNNKDDLCLSLHGHIYCSMFCRLHICRLHETTLKFNLHVDMLHQYLTSTLHSCFLHVQIYLQRFAIIPLL